MHMVIVGIGAMGCLFGAQLSKNYDVTLLGRWSEQIQALQAVPLRVLYPNGETEQVRLRVLTSEKLVRPADIVLVLTKSYNTALVAETAGEVLKSDGLLVTLQNGIGNYEILAKAVGTARATLGVTTSGATIVQPGIVKIGGIGKTTLASRLEISEKVKNLVEIFTKSHFVIDITENIDGLVWGKLAVNAGINPLTAILRVQNGRLLESQSAQQILAEAVREVEQVANALGIKLPYRDVVEACKQVARSTALNRSSMLQDIQRGSRTEIDVICGAVIHYAEQVGVATPVNRMLYQLVKACEEVA